LQKQIAEFLAQGGGILCIEGFKDLVGFLAQGCSQRLGRLLHIPRAAAGSKQAGYDPFKGGGAAALGGERKRRQVEGTGSTSRYGKRRHIGEGERVRRLRRARAVKAEQVGWMIGGVVQQQQVG
jgi:hypothetical protein